MLIAFGGIAASFYLQVIGWRLVDRRQVIFVGYWVVSLGWLIGAVAIFGADLNWWAILKLLELYMA